MNKSYDVIGFGNTLMDFLIEVDDGMLTSLNLNKGEFHLIDQEKANGILTHLITRQLPIQTVPGGSSANTLRGIAFLGGKAILYGKVGQDTHGISYVKQVEDHGVISRITTRDDMITGHAITFITPDAQRTFSVHLGAAVHLTKEDVLEDDVKNSKILHLEGYQLEGPTLSTMVHTLELAKKHHTLISMDLADPGVIRRNKNFLQTMVQKYVDILFVNEQEAKEFTDMGVSDAAQELGKWVKTAVIKVGAQGSLIQHQQKIMKVDAFSAQALDTTGAGDTYAAGFLYGHSQGWKIEDAGKLGSLFASKIVEQIGVKMKHLDAEELKRMIQ
ncbi:TPA: adenosine kinase [Candidatus Woesearchaeota archaeon]|nr:adenosine kinase [Candidatus Woesearchaeota archaeon]